MDINVLQNLWCNSGKHRKQANVLMPHSYTDLFITVN